MQSQEIKEVRVGQYDNYKKVMYLTKEMLLNTDKINIAAGTNSAGIAAVAAETLARLGYITYDYVKTETIIDHEKRRIRFIVAVKKTSNFNKLYKENEENRKKKEAERLTKEQNH